MRVVVLAPIDNSPFALATLERARREPGVEIAGVVVRSHLQLARVRSELRRDGVRLLRKAWRKLVLESSEDRTERGFYAIVEELAPARRTLRGFAAAHGIPHLPVSDPNTDEAVAWVRQRAPDVVAFTGGGLVRAPLLEASGQGILNAHMGLLPPYRGMDVVEWPLLEGQHERIGLGVTLHFMDRGVDTGPIVARYPVAIRPGDGIERLRTRFEPVMVDALLDGIRRVRDGALVAEPQAPKAGRQYFVLHPRLYGRARAVLASVAGPGPVDAGGG